MGLLMVIMGVFGVVIGHAGYSLAVIRDAEDILPDHDQITATA